MFVVRFAYAGLVTVMTLGTVGSVASAATIETFDRSQFATLHSTKSLRGETFDDVPLGPIAETSSVTISASQGAVVVTSLFLTTSGTKGLGWGDREYFSSAQSVTFNFTIAISAFAIDINTYATERGAFVARFDPELDTGPQRGRDSGDTAAVAYSRFDPFPTLNSKGEFLGQFLGFSSSTPFRSVTLAKVSKGTFTLDTLQYLPAAQLVPIAAPAPVPVPAGLPLLAGALAMIFAARFARVTHSAGRMLRRLA